MKAIKILLCALFAFCVTFTARAQSPLIPVTDTLTNTDTARLVIKVPGSNNVLTFQLNYTKISGTSASSVILQGSLDGVNYVTIPGTDTATVIDANGVQAFTWELPRSNYLWYRLYGTTGGTQSGQIRALALFRP